MLKARRNKSVELSRAQELSERRSLPTHMNDGPTVCKRNDSPYLAIVCAIRERTVRSQHLSVLQSDGESEILWVNDEPFKWLS